MQPLTQRLALAAPGGPVAWPAAPLFALPEKVLQFGSGALLRGLPDCLIDAANRRGLFNGRIVVVAGAADPEAATLRTQDGLFTVCVPAPGQLPAPVVCASIGRVLAAETQWPQVLALAASPALQVVLSDTAGHDIRLVNEPIFAGPPTSFPGRLLAVLYARFRAFAGDAHRGLVVLPAAPVANNGRRLEALVLELAHRHGLGGEFMDWLESANCFCNTFLACPAPDHPAAPTPARHPTHLGYQDGLLTLADAHALWVIEGDDRVRAVLPEAARVVIEPNGAVFRDWQRRLLPTAARVA